MWHHCADHWLRTIRTGRRTNSSSLDKRDAGKFGTIDYQSFYRDTQLALNGRKKVELLVGVWEREGAGWRGRGVYPPPQKSRLSTFPDGRFQCAPRVRTIGIKWLSGFIMMGPARAEFYRAPRKLDLCCDLSWRVHFRFFNGLWDFSRVIFDEASMESKKIWLISISKERWEKKKIIFIKLWFEILANSWFSLAWIFPF